MALPSLPFVPALIYVCCSYFDRGFYGFPEKNCIQPYFFFQLIKRGEAMSH